MKLPSFTTAAAVPCCLALFLLAASSSSAAPGTAMRPDTAGEGALPSIATSVGRCFSSATALVTSWYDYMEEEKAAAAAAAAKKAEETASRSAAMKWWVGMGQITIIVGAYHNQYIHALPRRVITFILLILATCCLWALDQPTNDATLLLNIQFVHYFVILLLTLVLYLFAEVCCLDVTLNLSLGTVVFRKFGHLLPFRQRDVQRRAAQAAVERITHAPVEPQGQVHGQGQGLTRIAEHFKCAICCEVWSDPVALAPCQHIFCRQCAVLAFTASPNCPECRVRITARQRPHRVLVNVTEEVNAQVQVNDEDYPVTRARSRSMRR